VSFSVLMTQGDSVLSRATETHCLRYYFPIELEYFLECAGFSSTSMYPFLEVDRPVTENDWSIAVMTKAS
jgi:hypothetical protein